MYAFDKLSVITLPLLLRAEISNVSCFWDITYFQNSLLFPHSMPFCRMPFTEILSASHS